MYGDQQSQRELLDAGEVLVAWMASSSVMWMYGHRSP